MVDVAIYYQLNKNEKQEKAIENINKLIKQLETHHVKIKEIFIDKYKSRDQLEELTNLPLSELDCIYINKIIDDEFDSSLIRELSKSEQFEVRIFNEF
ncbi:hypothetical protein KFZ56_16250 [Virgibacillus sp. NKC19-3]|uniref:hypothetical protein n=1 Tax=Virgibacillus saliphilus TaxID=2831674 RepID=UPI001C9A4B31|nr:hypothetical protein [Virgibacillus sp. NKC19-3]MBY7144573.1 hypothetical protein [Virgibacillus sp. NKC19-3]